MRLEPKDMPPPKPKKGVSASSIFSGKDRPRRKKVYSLCFSSIELHRILLGYEIEV